MSGGASSALPFSGRCATKSFCRPHMHPDNSVIRSCIFSMAGREMRLTGSSLTHLVEVASRYALIIVTPQAVNSWYVNSATNPADRYADYIADDLIAEIDGHYRTIASSHQRAVAGLSMGGYGALLLTLRHPDLFGFAGSISGAFAGPSGIEHVLPELKPSTDEAFGPPGSATRKENDLDTLIEGADPAKTPYMFLECGTSDPLLPSDRHVVAELSARGFTYEYHELPGAHTWSFWDNSVPPLLDVLSRTLHLEESDSHATYSSPLKGFACHNVSLRHAGTSAAAHFSS